MSISPLTFCLGNLTSSNVVGQNAGDPSNGKLQGVTGAGAHIVNKNGNSNILFIKLLS
tara:strand:- start:1 stop:174 length:174 start_codon:yes stop_codon:yes gene_type:complete